MKYLSEAKIPLILACLAIFSCEDDDKIASLRTPIDYNSITATTPYSSTFVDASGNSTVDLTEGHRLLQMFQAMNYYATSNVAENTPIDATTLADMFSNTNNPFYDISTNTIDVSGEELNSSGLQLRNAVASSLSAADAEGIRSKIQGYFSPLETASQFVTNTASPGHAGKLGNYLVDARGIEIAQVIQKSLIGALQFDYIANVLLDEGLNAENKALAEDHNYTQLEHNWDVAYGLLTLNPIFLEGATDASRNTNEFGLGAYLWEYNKAAYADIYPSFLKGRAAIVNNDRDQYVALATSIRMNMEKAMANAALGYLNKWKTGETEAARAHAIAEGLGFIYSLRFANLHGADAAFSDGVLTALIDSANGFWDLDAAKINAAAEAIQVKFDL